MRDAALTHQGFCAVRLDSDAGKEWLDVSTISMQVATARQSADLMSGSAPGWGKANPVVRIMPVEIREVWEGDANVLASAEDLLEALEEWAFTFRSDEIPEYVTDAITRARRATP